MPKNVIDQPFEVQLMYFPTMPIRLKRLPNGQMTLSGRNHAQRKGWAAGLTPAQISTPEKLAERIVDLVGDGTIAPRDLKERRPLEDQKKFAGLDSVEDPKLKEFWTDFEAAMTELFGEMGYHEESDAPSVAGPEFFG